MNDQQTLPHGDSGRQQLTSLEVYWFRQPQQIFNRQVTVMHHYTIEYVTLETRSSAIAVKADRTACRSTIG